MLYNEPAALAVNQEKLAVKAKHTLTCLFETVLVSELDNECPCDERGELLSLPFIALC